MSEYPKIENFIRVKMKEMKLHSLRELSNLFEEKLREGALKSSYAWRAGSGQPGDTYIDDFNRVFSCKNEDWQDSLRNKKYHTKTTIKPEIVINDDKPQNILTLKKYSDGYRYTIDVDTREHKNLIKEAEKIIKDREKVIFNETEMETPKPNAEPYYEVPKPGPDYQPKGKR